MNDFIKKNYILIIFFVLLVIAISLGSLIYRKNKIEVTREFGNQNVNKSISQKNTNISQINPNEPGENNTDIPLSVAPGFSISVFAKNLSGARDMVMDSLGNIWVSRTDQNVVTMLELKDGKVSNQSDVLKNLNHPHGLALDPEAKTILYIAEQDKISRVPLYTESTPEDIIDLPVGGMHTTRSLVFGPDGRLYVSIGSSCNVCVEKDYRRAKIFFLEKDGNDFREFSSGLRNSVFMNVNPKTHEIWATDMGRDGLGNNLPPDEINIIKEGKNYGWPYCYGKQVLDKTFSATAKAQETCNSSESSYIDIPAHSAPLGLAFLPERPDLPQDYWNNLLVAEHGSMNRAIKAGYKIVRYKLDNDGNYIGEEDFITGWINGRGQVLGRPAGMMATSDGRIFVSDDQDGVIYLIQRKK